ncbi:proline-rich protein 27 [Phyllostomus hastatus]|uniref:proline-rich protein 27 n=1 Tax=Phyllostomus hastatus TaxID=9423 RepID=UPI001E67F707|nr:proline-rich protein 27 [Phyllostomus hastatus]
MKILALAFIMALMFVMIGADSSSEEDHPVNPFMDIPYPMSENNFPPPGSPSENNLPKNLGNPNTDPGKSEYPWILSAPRAPLNRIPSFPTPTWLDAPRQKDSSVIHTSNRPIRPFVQSSAVDPIKYVAKPSSAPLPPAPACAIEPAGTQPDEVERALAPLAPAPPAPATPAPATPAPVTHAAPEPYSSTSLDPVGCLNLTPVIYF